METIILINLAGLVLLLFKYITLKRSYDNLTEVCGLTFMGVNQLIAANSILYAKIMEGEDGKSFAELLEEVIGAINDDPNKKQQ